MDVIGEFLILCAVQAEHMANVRKVQVFRFQFPVEFQDVLHDKMSGVRLCLPNAV